MISEGQFVISNPTILEDVVVAQAIDFLDDGFFNIVAKNMSAHIGIETSMDLTARKDFNKTLTTIGIPGFTVSIQHVNNHYNRLTSFTDPQHCYHWSVLQAHYQGWYRSKGKS